MIPFDQRIAKLRILLKRADTACDAQKTAMYAADEERIRLFSELMKVARSLGYCGLCEKPLDECKCLWMAKAEQQP